MNITLQILAVKALALQKSRLTANVWAKFHTTIIAMQLININKARYRRHLYYLIVMCIAVLVIGSLGISQLLIALYPDASGSHFHWNLTGVVITGLCILVMLNRIRHHELMTEIVYVWELKQALNKIARKMPKLKPAAQQGSYQAMLALQYSYSGSRLLWQLDDNTIVMDDLALAQNELDVLAQKYEVSLDADDYHPGMLKTFDKSDS